ncbi:MAG: hypothetical protein ACTSRG_05660 [Candidatus Helarchaeota archaeon]
MTDTVFDNRIAIVLILILLIGAILSGFAHIYIYHFTVTQWLLVNMCSPSSIATSIGLLIYIFKPEKAVGYFLVACADFLFAFSIMGIFILITWSTEMIVVQIMHFIMIFTGIYILFFVYKDVTEKHIKPLFLKGILSGLIVFLMLIFIVYPIFFAANPGIFDRYLFHFF